MSESTYAEQDPELYARIQEARKLRRDDDLGASQELLLALLDDYEKHPLVLFEVGGSYDVLGDEEKAIPYYRRAVAAGLEGDDLQECLICLGNTLGIVGDLDESVTVLESALKKFPDRPSNRVFLALAYHYNNQPDDAVGTLLDVILRTTEDADIQAYAGTLEYYRDELTEGLTG